jgi:osmoprotectant transport system substrate-binding protein
MSKNLTKLGAVLAVTALSVALSGCGSDPTSDDTKSASGTITVGSAGFPESEILAEIYGQALEAKGITVKQKPSIGEREVYFKALEDGSIDLIPDYTGNLLSYLDPKTTATSAADVEAALGTALPKDIGVLDASKAEDKDSYNVTAKFAADNSLKTIGDLGKVKGLKLGGPPPLAERTYGIPGLEKVYGIKGVKFTAIKDGGGPNTLKALLDGKIDVADIFTTTPSIADNKLVTLEDPKNLIAAQNVVPLISTKKASAKVKEALDAISAQLTTQDLVDLNRKNQGADKTAPATLAKEWLTEKGLL